METRTSTSESGSQTSSENAVNTIETSDSFAPGSLVIYGFHGKCQIVAIENRAIGDQSIPFYKLEVQRSTLSRSTRKEPAIWLPVASAKERGLRNPISNQVAADSVISIISNREYYFQPNEPWTTVQPKLEACIRSEGAIGLAKVASFLYVVKRKQIVPPAEVLKFQESVNKLLLRELSEALNEPIRVLEDRVSKMLRSKMIPDN
jgi:RNA polymerase-interacting CarD/CdnL/TRCF family regulator